jgi:hypothetical protein
MVPAFVFGGIASLAVDQTGAVAAVIASGRCMRLQGF